MAREEHVEVVRRGQDAVRAWRKENPRRRLDLSSADLSDAKLAGSDLSGANLFEADLSLADMRGAHLARADLTYANLSNARLQGADLGKAKLMGANLVAANLSRAIVVGANLNQADLGDAKVVGADLSRADLSMADLPCVDFSRAILDDADLSDAKLLEARFVGTRLLRADLSRDLLARADLTRADLSYAKLVETDLSRATLFRTTLTEANLALADFTQAKLGKAVLCRANLSGVRFLETDLNGADLTGCRVYGVSAWNVDLTRTAQSNLLISPRNEPAITVDQLELAQFIYLLLRNQKIRNVIDTITSKVVLILGRFTPERKRVLDAIREELRHRDFVPVLFDFDIPRNRNITETVTLLARMARFIIADLTDPKSLPQELQAIIPDLEAVPVQPILRLSDREYAMFADFVSRSSVLPIFRYKDERDLLRNLGDKVIQPAQERRQLLEHVREEGRSAADLLDQRTRRVRALEKEVQRLRAKTTPRSGA
jgi:uncharacterized protein YjbI with pentapeptide repeats